MKRILSLLLCLVLALACLTSCANNTSTDEDDLSKRGYVTLKFAIVTDERTDAVGLKAMQDAFNAVSEQKYETHVEFINYTAAEYESAMASLMEQMAAGKGADDAAREDAKADSSSSTTAENTSSYPAVKKNQLDLLVISSKTMFDTFVKNGWIVSLNDQLSGTYKDVLRKVTDEVDTQIKVNDTYYAIPARAAVGEYTYLAVNKEATERYNISLQNVTSLSSAYELILNMQSRNDLSRWQEKYGADFSPILNTQDTFVYPNVRYLSKNGTDFSMFGILYKAGARTFGISDVLTNGSPTESNGNLLFNKDYTRYLEMVVNGKTNGYFGTGNEKDFLVGIVKGDYALRNSNPSYAYYPLENPRVCDEDIFNGMLAVSSFTVNEKRAVELIQNLMTENSLLNILLYGEEDNYVTSSDGVVSFLQLSNYALDRNHLVGNLEEFASPCADYGQGADYYECVANQNKDLATILFDDVFDKYIKGYEAKNEGEESIQGVKDEFYLDAISAEYYARLMNASSVAAFRSALADVQADIAAAAEDPNSLISQSFNWDNDYCIAWALRRYVQAVS